MLQPDVCPIHIVKPFFKKTYNTRLLLLKRWFHIHNFMDGVHYQMGTCLLYVKVLQEKAVTIVNEGSVQFSILSL